MSTLEEIYPAFRLRITCGRVGIRPMTPDDIPAVLALAREGIYERDGLMPFLHAWDQEPDMDIKSPHFWYSTWATSTPARWTSVGLVSVDGEPVGVQDVMSKSDFRVTKSLSTGSWLVRRVHGNGIGTLMRQMIAVFAFDHLGARELLSEYKDGNAASAAVSRKTGYVDNGQRFTDYQGEPSIEYMIRLTPERLVRPADPVIVENADAFRDHFGITLA